MARTQPHERFASLQGVWQSAQQAQQDLRNELDHRYQSYRYAPAGKRRELERLDGRERKACERFYALLDEISPRNWRSSVPVSWTREALTYQQATTHGQLDPVPPPAYRHTAEDMRRFAWPLTSASTVDVGTITEYGLTQKLSNVIRCF